ncbi:hypothetical protein [Halanaerobium salsuginis]|uniref:Uncharacterized protein n=1 Tax=Halanaerobium salsuginis TaxID=29563 RepID=A0A1I4FY44_9FIRM|nr:hypothetical protein [Halanaerobium salsuginis]SFL22842.1 hypothetical protein SAMN02983006_00553 [Halanaerobium salsuginis]
MPEERRLSEVGTENIHLEALLEEYKELGLEIDDLKQIQSQIDRGAVYRLAAQIKDFKGQPLKYFSKIGLNAAYDSIKSRLDSLPIEPDRTFLINEFSEFETVIIADWNPPFLLKCSSKKELLDILIKFQKYLNSEIDFCDASIDLGILSDDPAVETKRSLKFKELFLD